MKFYPFQVDDFLAWVLVFEGHPGGVLDDVGGISMRRDT